MSYINNMNPRRMIWFNQNAPKNKMDLWLSYNQHYEDTSDDETTDPQQTTDNPSLRKCDLILKAWDCGRWVPIVGFNSTAANKIDTVTGVDYTIDGVTHSGKEVYHPAIFTNESPNELYDAGTLGSLLSDQHFVSEQEWYDVFNSTDYSWDNIFGDTNWFGDLTWSIILSGSSSYHLPWATTTQCGGILSATHPVASSAFKPIEVKFYPNVPGYYQDEQHRLCVSAKDVIELINEYYEDNPSAPGIQPSNDFELWLATTNRIGGIKSDIHNSGANAFKPVECKFYPNYGIWSSLKERLCINADDIIDLFIDSFNSEYPLLLAGAGIEIGLTLDHSQITWAVLGLATALDGKYARSKINSQNNHIIEWVDSPDTWRPIQIGGTSISDNALNIAEGSGVTIATVESSGVTTITISASSTTSPITITEGEGIDVTTSLSEYEVGISLTGASSGQVLSYNGTHVVWANPQTILYTAGEGIQIDSQNNTISSEIQVDSNNHVASQSIEFELAQGVGNNGLIKMSIDLNVQNTTSLKPFDYTLVTAGDASGIAVSFTIDDQKSYMKGDPVFVELDLRKANTVSVSFGEDYKYIDNGEIISSDLFKDKHVLVTMQFGIVKLEKIVDAEE